MARWRDDKVGDPDWSVVFSPGETFRGTRGDDRLVGTDFDDTFRIRQGGDDHVRAGKGRDTIYVGASLTAEDSINGGKLYDYLVLDGDYSSGLVLQTDTIARVEQMNLEGNFNYDITMASDMRQDKGYFVVDATQVQSLVIDGSALNFFLSVLGTSGDDVIIGGTSGDGLAGGAGFDVLTGGAGTDVFDFRSASDSISSEPDIITDFDGDFIYLAEIDGNTTKPGDQDLHFGATPNHTGDVTVTYDSGQDVTFVNVFTDSDATPDMVIQLLGDHSDLTAANFVL